MTDMTINKLARQIFDRKTNLKRQQEIEISDRQFLYLKRLVLNIPVLDRECSSDEPFGRFMTEINGSGYCVHWNISSYRNGNKYMFCEFR